MRTFMANAENIERKWYVIDAEGKLVTNYHVIEGAYSAKITLNGKTYDVKL
mgnify:CR=1 FL=1